MLVVRGLQQHGMPKSVMESASVTPSSGHERAPSPEY